MSRPEGVSDSNDPRAVRNTLPSSQDAPRRDADTPHLEAVIEQYLDDREAGAAPARDEYLRRYPQFADDLRQFFEDLDFVDARLDSQVAGAGTIGLGRWFTAENRDAPDDAADADTSTGLPRLKGFRLLEELGSGGQGVVYKAEQLGTRRTVALKVIREGLFASKNERRRFESEVELASRLTHPHIVSVYACGQDAGRDYFAMQYVDGEPLDLHLSGKRPTVRETLDLFLQICSAVSYAHQHGVIHRDLKPSNVLVDRTGRAHILDFGLAKAVASTDPERASGVTQVGHFAGTWYYASPEQAARNPALVDVRSDVYSLGVILYEMLTGRLPYPVVDKPRETVAMHIRQTPPTPPSAHRRDVDGELETIILCALHKEPVRRYQSAAALADDVQRYLAGEAIAAKRDSPWYVLRKTLKRYRWRVSAAAAALAALIVFALAVSLLYVQAISARATTEVRTRIVRNSQRYLVEKLDELNWASNRLAEIAHAHPELPQVAALGRETIDDPLSLFAPLVERMPDGLIEAAREATEPRLSDNAESVPRRAWSGQPEPPPSESGLDTSLQSPAAVEWLAEHESELARIARLAREKRFVFSVEPPEKSELVIHDQPGPVLFASRICDAFVARAWLFHHRGDTHAAAESLDAARSIAVDLSDGRLFLHKVMSVLTRDRIYDAVMCTLSQTAGQESSRAYIDWIMRDPPLVEYRLSMTSERQKMAQLCEAASFGRRPGDPGYLDFDTLRSQFVAAYPAGKKALTELRMVAESTRPGDALHLIDAYIQEVEGWDALAYETLRDRSGQLNAFLTKTQASSVIEPLFGDYAEAMKIRRRVLAKRAAARIAGRVCAHRIQYGNWPADLEFIYDAEEFEQSRDPYTGRPFQYQLTPDLPRIYSVHVPTDDHSTRAESHPHANSDRVFFPPAPCR